MLCSLCTIRLQMVVAEDMGKQILTYGERSVYLYFHTKKLLLLGVGIELSESQIAPDSLTH